MKAVLLIFLLFTPLNLSAQSAGQKIVFYFLNTESECNYENRVMRMGLNKLFDQIGHEFDGNIEMKCFPASRLKNVMKEDSAYWLTWGALSWYQDMDFNYEKSLPVFSYDHKLAVTNPRRKTLNDIKGLSIATLRGYTFPNAFENKLKKMAIEIQYVQTTDSCLGMLLRDRVAGCLQGTSELEDAVLPPQDKQRLKYIDISEVLPSEDVFILSSKKIDKATYERINKVIRNFLKNRRPKSATLASFTLLNK